MEIVSAFLVDMDEGNAFLRFWLRLIVQDHYDPGPCAPGPYGPEP